MKKHNIIISGGGTGGHIYPAIALADELTVRLRENVNILFVGALGKMEMQKVPEHGYPIVGLPIAGLQRRLTLKNLLLPFKIIASFFKSWKIIKKANPDFVICTGGYASLPIGYIANLKKIPYYLQEQNSYPGIVNRILSKNAQKIFVAYQTMEQFFNQKQIAYLGNPTRKTIVSDTHNRAEAINFFGIDSNKKTLLVLGGSQGAKMINQLIARKIDFFKTHNIQVIWQCGAYYHATYQQYHSKNVVVTPFIRQMEYAYSLADIIISRSGALSVSELEIVGKPVIFIPSPNVAEDHQTKNAQVLVNGNAAMMISENELEEKFEAIFLETLNNKAKELSLNIKKMGRPNASQDIVQSILDTIR